MTTSRAAEVAKRSRGRPSRAPVTFGRRTVVLLRADLTSRAGERLKWPSARYRHDPVGFAHDILGIEPWDAQVRILEAIRDHPRVAVKSGQKTGKSNSIAIAGLWLYCSFPDAQVVLTSTTARQVDRILWRELSKLKARGGRCLACKREIARLIDAGMTQLEAEARHPAPCPHSALIDGEIGRLARTGLHSEDFRSVTGFTAKDGVAIQGISGRYVWFILDEASGIADEIFEAFEGNRAGGARIVLLGNPNRRRVLRRVQQKGRALPHHHDQLAEHSERGAGAHGDRRAGRGVLGRGEAQGVGRELASVPRSRAR
jgi:phage terminase large subunit